MAYIPLESVESSMISKIGYDRKTQTLRVLFNNGNAYDYPTFTERDWAAFQEAGSVGGHFHRAIKPTFAHRRVEERQLRAPCCEHDKPDDLCDESCLPCDPDCCDGLTEAQRRQRLSALAGGIVRGQQLIENARQTVPVPTPLAGAEEDVSEGLRCAECSMRHSPEDYVVGDSCALAECDGVLIGQEDNDGTED